MVFGMAHSASKVSPPGLRVAGIVVVGMVSISNSTDAWLETGCIAHADNLKVLFSDVDLSDRMSVVPFEGLSSWIGGGGSDGLGLGEALAVGDGLALWAKAPVPTLGRMATATTKAMTAPRRPLDPHL